MKKTTRQFIKDAKKIHNNKYNYSKVEYKNNKTKICIICKKHGEFWQRTDHHLTGHGCSICSGNQQLTTKIFIKKANKIHNNKYDYSKVKYTNCHYKIEIVCLKHGSFWQMPFSHLQGIGCSICSGNKKLTTQQFIKKANKVHNNKYDYSKAEYKNNGTKLKIICPEHGEFWQQPNNHLQGQDCPTCNNSKGEKIIANILSNNDIVFEQEKRFSTCKNKKPLPFDFYLPDHNLLIEYDGEHHYKPVDIWGGRKTFIQTKEYDKIKNNYCKKNNINLIRIPYWNIDKIKNILMEKVING